MPLPFCTCKAATRRAFTKLAGERSQTSLIDKEMIARGETFVFDRSNWGSLWFAPNHSVRSECGDMIANRAVTASGTLLSYVFHKNRKRGFHAEARTPVAAIDEVKTA